MAATAGLLALVFSLGSWAYQHRRFTLHERRLHKALQERPTAPVLAEALLAEPGTRELRPPQTEANLRAFVTERSPGSEEHVLAKWRAAREVKLFAVEGMVYLLFFDDGGRLQSYALVAG